MKKNVRKKIALIACLVGVGLISIVSISAVKQEGEDEELKPMVVQQFFEEAKKNKNWKTAFATATHEQIVFMNISPLTNPNNEIGMEVHPFDQVILIVEGQGKAILAEKASRVKSGDMIFIPLGVPHNVINLDQEKELKLISFYSATDIPKGAAFKKKADEPKS